MQRLAWPILYVGFFCLFSCYMGGDGSPDSRIYHLYNGYVAVTGERRQDIAAAGMQTYFYPGLDALYYRLRAAMSVHPVRLEFLLGLPYALAAWLVWRIGSRTLPADWPGRESLAGAAALFGVTGAAGFAAIGTAMSEIAPGLPLLAGLLLWLRNRHGWVMVAAAGALAGLSVGMKLTELPLYVGFFVAVMAAQGPRPVAVLRSGLLFGTCGVAAALVVAGPWLLHNWNAYGNPIFPNFNDVFRSPLVDPGRWSDDRFKPHGLWRILVYPWVWAFHESHDAIELNMHDPRMLMELVAIVAILVRRAVYPAARSLALFGLIGYALWEYQFSIYRYLSILECLSGVLLLAAVAAWTPRRVGVWAGLGLLALMGVAAATTKYPWWDRSLPAGHVVEVHVPDIPPDALVVLLDPSALSYMLPFLPPSVTAVGANGNLVRPGVAGTLQRQIESTIRNWTGPIWGFENAHNFPGDADATLAYYGLQRQTPCFDISGNIEAGHSTACILRRVP